MKLYWFNKHCSVPECFNSSTEGKGSYKEYFDLPAEAQARARWLKAILTEDGDNLKVCEDHFRDEELFRDKNNRKKLRLNSVPSQKLPKDVCINCLGAKNNVNSTLDYETKHCRCVAATTPLLPIPQPVNNKRTRISWSAEEKKTLFKAIKKSGDVRVGNSKIRINWTNVVNYCRANGCFGNEKELRSVWQNMRANANKVHRNEIFGSKLERKVSRFIFGKRRSKMKTSSSTSNNESTSHNMETGSTDDDVYQEQSRYPVTEKVEENYDQYQENEDSAILDNGMTGTEVEYKLEDFNNAYQNGEYYNKEEFNNNEDIISESESDEYYSITDVEEKYHIQIRPRDPGPVISLLSSDEEE